MKAMVCEAFGGPGALVSRDLPAPPLPGAGEIQVRIRARGVQYVDVLMLAGKYQFGPEPPFLPGGEAAGEGGSVGVGAWRGRRHRHRRDPGGEVVRREGDRDRQRRGET